VLDLGQLQTVAGFNLNRLESNLSSFPWCP
jgi:hypothetical protein